MYRYDERHLVVRLELADNLRCSHEEGRGEVEAGKEQEGAAAEVVAVLE